MTEEPMRLETSALYAYGAQVGTARLYVEGPVDATLVVKVSLQTRLIQAGQTALPPEARVLRLAVDEAEALCAGLVKAIRSAHRREETGDH